MALNLTVHKPAVCIKDAVCAIPCTVENTYTTSKEVKVALFEGTTMLDVEPDTHYQDIPAGGIYDFNGFWDTLKFTPQTLKTYTLTVKLRVFEGSLTLYTFTIPCEEKPGFFDSLLASIGIGNKEQITDPMEELFEAYAIPGITEPPFTCPFCGQEFKATSETEEAKDLATDQYVHHLANTVNNYISAWFEED